MLRCSDSSYYIGVTSDLQKRLSQHQSGHYQQAYTYKRRPVELVYAGVFQYIQDAKDWEARIKRWSRKKKEALFIGDRDNLINLSKRQNNLTIVDRIREVTKRKIERKQV
jgi:putative endonuclease